MSLSLHPDRLKRYKDIARLLYKYGRADLVSRAAFEDVLPGEELTVPDGAPAPEELPADLEKLGPAFVKLGQVLSTRADLAGLRRDVQDLVASYCDARIEEMQAGRVMMEMTRLAGRHGIRLPSELTMRGKRPG